MEKIDKILKRTFKNMELEKRLEESKILKTWKDLVGEQIARHTRPMGIKRKKLFIKVDNSSWVYQLTLHHKTEILERVNQVSEKAIINDIYFKLGTIDEYIAE